MATESETVGAAVGRADGSVVGGIVMLSSDPVGTTLMIEPVGVSLGMAGSSIVTLTTGGSGLGSVEGEDGPGVGSEGGRLGSGVGSTGRSTAGSVTSGTG